MDLDGGGGVKIKDWIGFGGGMGGGGLKITDLLDLEGGGGINNEDVRYIGQGGRGLQRLKLMD